jgi:transcriptional regulator GlxA family with amidase domain
VDIAVVLFDRLTALDAIGPYEVLSRLPDSKVHFVATERGWKRTDTGALALLAEAALDELPSPAVLVVPGGPGQTDAMDDDKLLDWIRTAHRTSTWTTSVCTGSLILGAAGVLDGRRATSHWLALDVLPDYGAQPALERVVFDGKVVTAAGVSAGIDMALRLASRIAGDEVAQAIQLGLEYDPQPPFDAGSPTKAPEEIVAKARANSRFLRSG